MHRRCAPEVFADVTESRVAIIDDDDSLRTALVGLVRSFGYASSGFSSAEAYLAAAGDSDCIVTDIHMGGLSGIDLKQELTRRGDGTPVIMITARDDAGLEQRARASGAACFLKKPFETDDLIRCIETALQRLP
jgi:FixJ family two-component response regulator